MERKLAASAHRPRLTSVCERLHATGEMPRSRRRRAQALGAAAIEVQERGLVRLDLSLRRLTPQALSPTLEALRTDRLRSLDLGATRLDRDTVRQLAEALRANSSLEELNLFNCGLDAWAVDALASALHGHHALQSMTLAFADASASVEALVGLVQATRGLRALDLSWSRLGEPALRDFFNALPADGGLAWLRLRGLRLAPAAASALAAAVRRATGHPMGLDLAGCLIDEVDASRLIDAIAESGLWAIEWSGASLSRAQAERIDRVLQSNRGRSEAARDLQRCLRTDGELPLDLCAEILRHVCLDADSFANIQTLRARAAINPTTSGSAG